MNRHHLKYILLSTIALSFFAGAVYGVNEGESAEERNERPLTSVAAGSGTMLSGAATSSQPDGDERDSAAASGAGGLLQEAIVELEQKFAAFQEFFTVETSNVVDGFKFSWIDFTALKRYLFDLSLDPQQQKTLRTGLDCYLYYVQNKQHPSQSDALQGLYNFFRLPNIKLALGEELASYKDKLLRIATLQGNPVASTWIIAMGEEKKKESRESEFEFYRTFAHLGSSTSAQLFEKLVEDEKSDQLVVGHKKLVSSGPQGLAHKQFSRKQIGEIYKLLKRRSHQFRYGVPLFVFFSNHYRTYKDLAIEALRESASLGYVRAQFHLGYMYDEGIGGVEQNDKLAVEWYHQAAKQGLEEAQYNLSVLYITIAGKGVERNDEAELLWTVLAAVQGHTGAQCNLGRAYAEARCVEQNDERALYWIQLAAAQGNRGAQYNAATCYIRGKGIQQNYQIARAFFEESRKHEFTKASFSLGCLYSLSDNPDRNEDTALAYFLEGAQKDHTLSMIRAVDIFIHKRKFDQALFWLKKAQHQGYPLAEKHLTLLKEIDQKLKTPSAEEEAGLKQTFKALKKEQKKAVEAESEGLTTRSTVPQEKVIAQKPSHPLEESAAPSRAGEFIEGGILTDTDNSVKASMDRPEPHNDEEAGVATGPSLLEEDIDLGDKVEDDSFTTSSSDAEEGGAVDNWLCYQQMAKKMAERERMLEAYKGQQRPALLPENKLLHDAILKPAEQAVTLSLKNLQTLFQDPYFRQEVSIYGTKSGFMVTAHNRETNVFRTASTHRLHKKNAALLQEAFLKELRSLIQIFA